MNKLNVWRCQVVVQIIGGLVVFFLYLPQGFLIASQSWGKYMVAAISWYLIFRSLEKLFRFTVNYVFEVK